MIKTHDKFHGCFYYCSIHLNFAIYIMWCMWHMSNSCSIIVHCVGSITHTLVSIRDRVTYSVHIFCKSNSARSLMTFIISRQFILIHMTSINSWTFCHLHSYVFYYFLEVLPTWFLLFPGSFVILICMTFIIFWMFCDLDLYDFYILDIVLSWFLWRLLYSGSFLSKEQWSTYSLIAPWWDERQTMPSIIFASHIMLRCDRRSIFIDNLERQCLLISIHHLSYPT